MADAKSVVELVFMGVDKTGEATQAALQNVQSFSTNVQKLTAPIADVTEKAFKLEAALLLSTAALVGYSIKVAGEFDASFREIATLTGEASDNLGDFRQDILDYAATSTQPLDAITGAIYTAISAGVDYVDSVEFIRDAEMLAVAGKGDLTTATEILVSTLNAFGREATDAGDFADILFKTVQDGQTTLTELANGFARVTGLAAPAGIEMYELGAAVSTLTSTGVDTNQAMTILTGIISSIISPSEKAAKAAADLGIEFGASALAAEGLEGFLPTLAKAIDGNVEVAADLFGNIRALNGVLVLTSQDGLVKFGEALDGQGNRTGVVADAYADMVKSIEFSNQRVVTALQGLFIEIGDPLLEAYGGVADAIAAVFRAIGQNVSETGLEEVIDYIELLLRDTEAFFREIAKNIPEALEQADFSGFIRNIESVRKGLSDMLGGVDLTTADGLATFLTSVSDAFGLLGDFVGGALESFEKVVTIATNAFKAFSELDPKLASVVGNMAGWVTIFDKLLPALDTLLLLLIVKQTGGIAGGMAAAATGAAALATKLGALALYLGAGGVGYLIGTQLVKPLDEAIDRFTGSGSLGGLIFDFIEGYRDRSEGIFGIGNFIGDWILDWGNKTDDFSDAIDRNEQKIRDMNEQWGEVDGSVGDASVVFGDLVEYVDDANDALRDYAESQGFIIDDSGRWRELQQPLSEVVPYIQDIDNAIKDAATTTQSYGDDTGGTLSVIGSQFDDAGKAAEDAFEKTDAYFLKLMDLASDERIALIEARVSLDIAEVESNTEIVLAAFDSINNSISESYALLGDLFGLWADTDSAWDKAKLESFIKEEQRRLDKELELQAELVRAQIELIKAKTDAMYRGDAMIQIDGAGLQPHLEGFMWEILRSIQVRVNQDGLEQLLGTPA